MYDKYTKYHLYEALTYLRCLSKCEGFFNKVSTAKYITNSFLTIANCKSFCLCSVRLLLINLFHCTSVIENKLQSTGQIGIIQTQFRSVQFNLYVSFSFYLSIEIPFNHKYTSYTFTCTRISQKIMRFWFPFLQSKRTKTTTTIRI